MNGREALEALERELAKSEHNSMGHTYLNVLAAIRAALAAPEGPPLFEKWQKPKPASAPEARSQKKRFSVHYDYEKRRFNVYDDDFGYDASLSITGDFGTSLDARRYADAVADALNKAVIPTPEAAAPEAREPVPRVHVQPPSDWKSQYWQVVRQAEVLRLRAEVEALRKGLKQIQTVSITIENGSAPDVGMWLRELARETLAIAGGK